MSATLRHLVVIVALVIVGSSPADAYPQFLTATDPTCTGCHLSPAGGNLLNENGTSFAETTSQLGTAPEFMYGKVPAPEFFLLGGDIRVASGFLSTPEKVLATFPMQGELYLGARFGTVSVRGTVGARPVPEGNDDALRVWSREHYLMWQQDESGAEGMFVRLGKLMPVFGLRLAEHPAFIRRWGGTPLFAETYGAHVAYVKPAWEVHASAFIDQGKLISSSKPVVHDSGGAVLAEARVVEGTTLGGELMYSRGPDDQRIRVGGIAKQYFAGPALLLQAELQFVNGIIDETATNPDGGRPLQIVGNLMVSKFLTDFLLLDFAIGHFDSNLRIKDLDRDAVDMNLHYFLTSHLELVWNSRFQMIGFGRGGDNSGYSLLQLHYRL